MNPTTNWSDRLLCSALQELPSLVLSFYTFGILLTKRDGDRVSEFPVDPAQVALALSTKVRFDTGLLSENTLLVRHEGVNKIIVEYRPPCKTGLYLDDSDTPLRVPLPGLLLIRATTDNTSPQYQVYAVKQRPKTLDTALFHAPLPNVFGHGGICWGNVPLVSDEALAGTSLAEDWGVLLGSRFNAHGCGGKSKRHPQDIRKTLIELEQHKARRYPKSDLVAVNKTLAQVLGDRT